MTVQSTLTTRNPAARTASTAEASMGRLAMRPREQLIRETLRRLRQHHERAVETLDKPVAFNALDRVAWSDGGERRPRLHGRGQHSSEQGCGGQRPCGVVDEHEIAPA